MRVPQPNQRATDIVRPIYAGPFPPAQSNTVSRTNQINTWINIFRQSPRRTAIPIPSFWPKFPTSKPSTLPTQQLPGLLPFVSYIATLQLRSPAQKFRDAQTSTQSSKLYTNASESVDAPGRPLRGDSTSQYFVKLRPVVAATELSRPSAKAEVYAVLFAPGHELNGVYVGTGAEYTDGAAERV